MSQINTRDLIYPVVLCGLIIAIGWARGILEEMM